MLLPDWDRCDVFACPRGVPHACKPAVRNLASGPHGLVLSAHHPCMHAPTWLCAGRPAAHEHPELVPLVPVIGRADALTEDERCTLTEQLPALLTSAADARLSGEERLQPFRCVQWGRRVL